MNILFVIFILSASAMDSENVFIPAVFMVLSLVIMKWRIGKYGCM